MAVDQLHRIREYLDRCDLAGLFNNVLGWSNPDTSGFPIQVQTEQNSPARSLEVSQVAQMSSIAVYQVNWPFNKLPSVTQRRAVYSVVSQRAYEHLMVYVSNDRRQLAFVYARRHNSLAKQVELRTLPYEVGTISRTSVERIAQLTFGLEELEDAGFWITRVIEKLDEAFNVERVTNAFFAQYQSAFTDVENTITMLDSERRRLFVQKLFNRLMFIRFVEQRGWLTIGHRLDYLRALWDSYQQQRSEGDNFYRDRLKLVFFSGFNNGADVDLRKANGGGLLEKLIGNVPFLNGGLFEEDEDDQNEAITVPDSLFPSLFDDLFYHFNFTTTESTPFEIEVAVDPEMLGKVFEKLVRG